MINNNLKFCREEIGLTQKELGKIFNVKNNTVSGWELGLDTMPFEKLVKFCNLYDYSLDFVIGLSRKNISYPKIKIDKVILGNKLKYLRKKLHLTQQQLSDECNISRTTYSSYECGRYLINTITIYTICKTYNISMDWFCGRKKKIEL